MSPQGRLPPGTPASFGQILNPFVKTTQPRGIWCADNGCFSDNYSDAVFFDFLDRFKDHQSSCVFVAVPDTVGNAIETLDKFRRYAWQIKSLGWPVAFVCQDGQESLPLPPEYDALFIGGSTEWKLSPAADYLIRQARKKKKWTHVGRVNSEKRIRHFQLVGVNSVDGTKIIYEPSTAYKYFHRAISQIPLLKLFEMELTDDPDDDLPF